MAAAATSKIEVRITTLSAKLSPVCGMMPGFFVLSRFPCVPVGRFDVPLPLFCEPPELVVPFPEPMVIPPFGF